MKNIFEDFEDEQVAYLEYFAENYPDYAPRLEEMNKDFIALEPLLLDPDNFEDVVRLSSLRIHLESLPQEILTLLGKYEQHRVEAMASLISNK